MPLIKNETRITKLFSTTKLFFFVDLITEMEGPQLVEAASQGRYEAVEALLRERAGKAAINYTDEVRETALYKAVTFNHPQHR